MKMKNNLLKIFFALFVYIVSVLPSFATEIDKNTAIMQAMDKITGRVNVINVPVGGAVDFYSLSIVVRSCKSRPVEEAPENFAFVDITDKNIKGEEFNIFKGWMISSSPATNAVEHPIYDIWLLQCQDTDVDKKLLWSEQALTERDNLPMSNASDTFVAAQKAEKPVADSVFTKPMSEMEAAENTAENKNEKAAETDEFSYDEEDDSQPEELSPEKDKDVSNK